MQPPFYIHKRFCTRYVVDNNDPMCSSVIRWRNSPEAFLASCVPDLEFHLLSIDLNCSDFKIHSNGGNVAAWRESVGKWEPKSCLFWMSQSTLLEH